jgi:hypothetical protein
MILVIFSIILIFLLFLGFLIFLISEMFFLFFFLRYFSCLLEIYTTVGASRTVGTYYYGRPVVKAPTA